MTSRAIGFLLCAIPGLLVLAGGLVVPAHLRAVDASVLERAGQGTTALVQQGLALVRENQLGAANLTMKEGKLTAIVDQPPQILLERPTGDLPLSAPQKVPMAASVCLRALYLFWRLRKNLEAQVLPHH